MKYRPHRASLKDSLCLQIEASSMSDIIDNIREDNVPSHAFDNIVDSDITFEYCCFDKRCGWNTYYVCAFGAIVGMSDNNKFHVE